MEPKRGQPKKEEKNILCSPPAPTIKQSAADLRPHLVPHTQQSSEVKSSDLGVSCVQCRFLRSKWTREDLHLRLATSSTHCPSYRVDPKVLACVPLR